MQFYFNLISINSNANVIYVLRMNKSKSYFCFFLWLIHLFIKTYIKYKYTYFRFIISIITFFFVYEAVFFMYICSQPLWRPMSDLDYSPYNSTCKNSNIKTVFKKNVVFTQQSTAVSFTLPSDIYCILN